MKTLTLVTAGTSYPDQDELLRLEAEDKHPRASLFPTALNSELLDERFIKKLPRWRRLLYEPLPTWLAQVIEAYVQRKNYDAVISWAEHLAVGFALLLRLTGSRVPHVALLYSISTNKKARLLSLAHKRLDRLILWTSSQREFARNELHIPPSKVVPASYLVDQKFYRPMRVESDMICSAGREMRDYGTLIRALRDTGIRCHIAAYAVPRKRDAWIKEIEDAGPLPPHITLGKMKNFAELRALYARSRFVVVPLLQNDTDSGTTVILEAMAMGKAVICSRTRGQRDHIQDGKTGIYVPVEDPRALREAIQHLWDHPDVAERMGGEGRKLIEQHHTLDLFVDQVRRVVEEVIAEYKSSEKHP